MVKMPIKIKREYVIRGLERVAEFDSHDFFSYQIYFFPIISFPQYFTDAQTIIPIPKCGTSLVHEFHIFYSQTDRNLHF